MGTTAPRATSMKGTVATTTPTTTVTTDSTTATSDPCPPGKYMHMGERGSSAARSQCKPCAPGFFKSTTSKIVTCTAHTKCPPGKHTIASGSATSQPQCEKCATGFYKSITSRSSICAGCPSDHCIAQQKCPAGKFTQTVGSTSFEPKCKDVLCESWCAQRSKPWATKCTWSRCAACFPCSSAPTGTATTAASCRSWCASNVQTW